MSLRHGGPHFSNAPPSLEAANQAQIDDLVQRNRTFEYTIKKLNEQVAQEQVRTRDAVTEIQSKWDANQQLWKEGCESVLSSYRIVQKKLEIEVETERAAVIKEMAITREEKLQRIQRDVKIKRFQMREQELERRLEELEEERASFSEAVESELQEEKEKSAAYASKLKEIRESSRAQIAELRNALQNSKQERDDKEAEFIEMVSKNSVLENKVDSLERKIQRVTLNLEGLQTRMADADRLTDELKREKANLSNQLERWQSLENKGGEVAEQQRKQVVALELQLREIQEAREQETDKASRDLDKAQRRLEKAKNALVEWETRSSNQEQENTDMKKQLTKLQKANDKLKAELEEERARVRPPTPQKSRNPISPLMDVDVEETEEDAIHEEPMASKKASLKATTAKPGPSTLAEEPDKSTKPFTQIAKKSTGGRPPRPRKMPTSAEPEIVEISDHEMEKPAPTTRRKAKAEVVERDDVEEEDVPPRNQKGKRKVTGDNGPDVLEVVDKPRGSKKGSRAPSEAKDLTATKGRGKRAGSKQPAVREEPERDDDEEDDEDQIVPKKKKRKIIPPITSGNGPFAFGSLNLTQFDDALGIPSVLSPLKQDERVPHRSTSSNLVNSIGNLMKNSLSGIRKP